MKRASFLGVSSRRLEKEMATHSSVLAWRIPGMGEPGGPLEKEMANHFSILALEPQEQYEKANDKILKEELPRSIGAQYATGDQWRNNSRKNEGMEPKQKQYPAVDVTGDRSKV